MSNYIYLLQEREFIKTREHIYKLGRSKKENLSRFNQYPKGSLLLFQQICNDCVVIETALIKKFKELFRPREDVGREYFEGDYQKMIDVIYNEIKGNMPPILPKEQNSYLKIRSFFESQTTTNIMTDIKIEFHRGQESYPEIRAFFESRPLTAANCEVKGGDLYDMFAAYCRDRLKKLRVSPANSKTFITECRRKGFVETEPVVRRIQNKSIKLVLVKAEWCRPADETIIM